MDEQSGEFLNQKRKQWWPDG